MIIKKFIKKTLTFLTLFAIGTGFLFLSHTSETPSKVANSFWEKTTSFIESVTLANVETTIAGAYQAVNRANANNEASSDKSLLKSPSKDRRIIPNPTIEEQVPKEGKFLGADLTSMKLYLYENGELINELPILSKGRPGSQWETPSGSYKILYKNENHFSSIGQVYMPYSMQFYGNFFIHGWPYYPGGEEVGEGFSGGCIRLSTTDSQAVFEFGDIDTPLYVYENEGEEAKSETLKNIPAPRVTAKSYLVADLSTGEVFLEKDSFTPLPIASISKLMTAVVANETISYDKLITVTPTAFATYGTQGGILTGERMSLTTMFFPLLLNSSNDAATAIAEYRGYGTFMELMNSKARALDMKVTHFEDPSGLSEHNVSSANDLFNLAKYIFERKRFIFDITTQISRTVESDGVIPTRTYANNNPMRERVDFLGGKNGYTPEARKTLLSVFQVPNQNSSKTVVIIVLGSEDHTNDTLKLLEWTQKTLN